MTRGVGFNVRRLLPVAAAAVVATAILTGAAGADQGGVLVKPIDPKQLLLVPFGKRSHWLQPWRSYLDTVPASRLIDAVGINFNVGAKEAAATARLLGSNGFRRARIEEGWGSVDYADPTELVDLADFRSKLRALKANRIRPLILLNANDTDPCPSMSFSVVLTVPASKGERTLHIDPAGIAGIVPGRTGLDTTGKKGKAAAVIVTSVAPDGTAELSKPLGADLPLGTYKLTTLLYQPFGHPRLPDGSANPEFETTLQGWLSYVGLVTKTAKQVLGSEDFDVEVWNELTFGSSFLKLGDYYDPAPKGSGSTTDEILARTVSYLRDPANGVSTIGIGDGFANQTPFAAGSSSPVGLTALDKHPYPGVHSFPTEEASKAHIEPVDALGRAVGTKDAKKNWSESFVPSYTAFFPEWPLTALQTESLTRDIAPFTAQYGDALHGRATAPAGGKPVTMWITETNMNPRRAIASLTQAQFEHLQAKIVLRALVAYVNKGVSAVDFFAAKSKTFGLIPDAFFSHTDKQGSAGGALTAVRRLVAGFGKVDTLSSTRPLSLLAVGDHHNHFQFQGDGTPAHPTLYDRDVVAFLPFQAQATRTRYVVPVYVMTRDVAKVYKPTSAASDLSRYDLPPETFQVTIGGLPGKWHLSLYDPLQNRQAPVTVLSHTGSKMVLNLPLTDSPRLLTISR